MFYSKLLFLTLLAVIAADTNYPLEGLKDVSGEYLTEAITLLDETLAKTSYRIVKVSAVKRHFVSGILTIYKVQLNAGRDCLVKILESQNINIQIECKGDATKVNYSLQMT